MTERVVLHHPRHVDRRDSEPRILCEESAYGIMFGMNYSERPDGKPYSDPCATPIMHAWLKEHVEMPTGGCTVLFPQCGTAVTEVALLKRLIADGLIVRHAIFMDHIMELINLDQFECIDARCEKIDLFWRYKDLNAFLLDTRPANLVVIGVHARMFYGNFPLDDYVEFLGICRDTCSTPYVNFRQLVCFEDYCARSEFELTVNESYPTVVVWNSPWDVALQYAITKIGHACINEKKRP
jgi:hypothetical protein